MVEAGIRYDWLTPMSVGIAKYARNGQKVFFILSIFYVTTRYMAKRQPKTSQPLPLEPDEHILWEEQPEPSAYVKQRYGKLTAIGVILLGIVFFGVQDIFNRDGSSDFSIDLEESLSVMITFALLTLISFVLATSMLWGRKEAEDTHFYLTNKKLIVASGISPPQVLVYPPHSLGHLEIIRTKSGTGTLYFREEKPLIYGGLYKKRIGFEGIQDPGEGYGLIHKVFYT